MQGIYGTRTRALIVRFIREHQMIAPDGMGEMTDRQLLEKMQELHPKFRSYFVGAFLGGLQAPDTNLEMQRREHIAAVNRLDDVHLAIADPGIPIVTQSFAGFYFREKYPKVEEAYNAVQDWLKGVPPKILTLAGPTGVGKSRLAIAAAQQLASEGKPVIYREESNMMRGLQSAMKNGTTESEIQQLEEVPWLVLEELGMTASSDWGKETIDRIINARWKNATVLHTLITTNLTGDQLPVRIASRLRDKHLTKGVLIDAPDYRRNDGTA